jgi:hypothetical protein
MRRCLLELEQRCPEFVMIPDCSRKELTDLHAGPHSRIVPDGTDEPPRSFESGNEMSAVAMV